VTLAERRDPAFGQRPNGAALVAMTAGYLVLIELAKRVFFADPEGRLPRPRRRGTTHRQHRRAALLSTDGGLRAVDQMSTRRTKANGR